MIEQTIKEEKKTNVDGWIQITARRSGARRLARNTACPGGPWACFRRR